MSIGRPEGQDEKYVAACLAVQKGRESLQDPEFLIRLGSHRQRYERALQELEAALKDYGAAWNAVHGPPTGTVAVVLGTAVAVGRAGAAGGLETVRPEVLIGGLLLWGAATALSGPSLAEWMELVVEDRELSRRMRDFSDTLPGPPPPTNFHLLDAVARTYVAALVAMTLAQQQMGAAAMAQNNASTLAGLLKIPPGNLTPGAAAMSAIGMAIAALIARGPPPHCRNMEQEYKTHFARANNHFSRGSSTGPLGSAFGLARTRIWDAFVQKAIDLVRCIQDNQPPPSGSAPA
jgi:hypothetical protein